SGDRLPYSSRVSANVSASQEFPLWAGWTGFVGGTVSYVGDRKGPFVATPDREIFPAYTKTDLRAGVVYDSWTANLYVNNATDVRGIVNGGAGSLLPNVFKYITPRTLGFGVVKSF